MRLSIQVRGRWAAMIGLALAAPGVALAQPVPTPPVAGQIGPPGMRAAMNRACLNDQFFIDVPIWANPGWSSATTFAATLRTAIDNVKLTRWFCSGTCTGITTTVTPLLPLRTGTDQAWRNDGDRRFFRVAFSRRGSTVSVLADRACEATNAIRAAAQAQAGAVPLFVGRECDASAMASLESGPSAEMVDWPKVAMEVPPNQSVAIGNVDIALIDSGIDPAVAAASDVQVAEQQSFVTGSTPLHPHGTAMALFLRQLAPQARLYDARVLSMDGHGMGLGVAKAIDWALFDKRTIGRPMVVNLSLGWPVHDSAYASITGVQGANPVTNCTGWEAPFGEPIRYLLTGARRGGIANIVAAAGNDPSTGDYQHVISTHIPPFPYTAAPACATLTTGSRWLYPARWDEQPSCFSDGVARYSALGASAVDARRQRSSSGIIHQEAMIVAPGEHVYAKHPAAAVNTGALACTTGTELPGVSLPRVFTGSSVSSAYVSGAIARAHDLWFNKTGTVLTPDQAQKLVYLTGRTLCRVPAIDQYARMVNVPRLERAISDQSCGLSLLACSSSGELAPGTTYNNCHSALVACGLEPAGPATCEKMIDGIDWPDTYVPFYCGGEFAPPTIASDECAQGGPLCPFEKTPSVIELGSLGPQPNTGGCPECRLKCPLAGGNWELSAELSNYFPGGTTQLGNPQIALSANGGTTKYTALVPDGSPASAWVIGAKVKMTIPSSAIPSGGNCANLSGNFWISQYNSIGIKIAENFSPIKFVKKF